MSSVLLESESETELELAHAARRPRRIVVFDVGDPARVAAAIYARVALGAAEGQHWVIEHVVSVKAELCSVPFGDGEGLRKGQVGVEPAWTTVRIAPDIADLAASG
jgi:hypothetical protein